METITKSIEVARPLSEVYNQWTQFENFPLFMEGVKSVEQVDEKHLLWHVEIAGIGKSWEAEIVEQVPDTRIAWRSLSGTPNTGIVNFESVDEDAGSTRVTLTLHYLAEGGLERVGTALGLVALRVQGDLDRFKATMEKRSTPPDGWRGVITDGEVSSPPPPGPAPDGLLGVPMTGGR